MNHILNPNMQFDLSYTDGTKLHNRNFRYKNGELRGQKMIERDSSPSSPDNNFPSISLSSYFKQNLETQVKMARNLNGALKDLAEPWKNFDRANKIGSYITKPSFCLFVPTLIAAIFTSGTLGTAFTAAAVVTGMCMLVGIVTSICLSVYAFTSCNSKINNPKVEEFQREPQLC